MAPSLTNMFQQINASVINGSLRPDVDQSRWDALDYSANFFAGWADSLTFGTTDILRNWVGINDGIDHESTTYNVGKIGGAVHSVALGGLITTSIAVSITLRVPPIRYALMLNNGGVLSFAPSIATTTVTVGTQQIGMLVAGGLGILHAKYGGWHEHHSNPRFMGGDPNQPTTRMPVSEHENLHRDLNNFLRGKTNDAGQHMRPQPRNSGAEIRENFFRSERLNAMAEFYMKFRDKYFNAARDFFKNLPHLK